MLKDKNIFCRQPVMLMLLRGENDKLRPSRKHNATRLLSELRPAPTRASWLAMRAYIQVGDRLLRVTAKLFFLGVLSRRKAYRLMRIAGRFTEAGLAITPRRRHVHPHFGRDDDGNGT
ncbi:MULTISPECIES: hypothetical protein [unclassified Beijerinckia]|uniref:hypothetical protein n=1 Tax=unclassified Beijerinckia TaxID=2638183 RepID=UPI00089AE4B7|nr:MULTISPECIES: hypothetical protein [unclassified Beijerinckia]MDH7796952.1 hypothetical protein [Beijerinckia sp. GAS462]SEC66402.1 hypothetical protein SAMN05443249_3238 [Beijerinckia sp. 28-YEA-48]